MDNFFNGSLKKFNKTDLGTEKHAHFFQLFFNYMIKVILFLCVFEHCMEYCCCYILLCCYGLYEGLLEVLHYSIVQSKT